MALIPPSRPPSSLLTFQGKILITNPSAQGVHVTAIDDDPALVLSGHVLGVLSEAEASAIIDAAVHAAPPAAAVSSSAAGGSKDAAASVAPVPNGATHAPPTATTASSSASRSTSTTSVRYVSTRSGAAAASVSFREAIFAGIAPDGGLYVPLSIPTVTPEELAGWAADPSVSSRCEESVDVYPTYIGTIHEGWATGVLRGERCSMNL